MKLNSLFTGRIGRPEAGARRSKIFWVPTHPWRILSQKKTHFVTIEIFLYVVGNPLGSMHMKSLRTGRSGKCRNLWSNTKVIFLLWWSNFSPELNSRQSIISQQIKPKLQNIIQKVLRSLNVYVIWRLGSTQFAYLCTDCKRDNFNFRKFAGITAILKTATIKSVSLENRAVTENTSVQLAPGGGGGGGYSLYFGVRVGSALLTPLFQPM